MRYEIGETVYAIRINFEASSFRFHSLYCPWLGDKLSGLEIKKLVVKEHHKVAWDQDENNEKKYDGYILEDETGKIWYNQYPTANFGQLDDSMNFKFVASDDTEFVYFDDVTIALKGVHGGYLNFNKISDAEVDGKTISSHLLKHYEDMKKFTEDSSGLKVKYKRLFEAKEEDVEKEPDFENDDLAFYLE